MSAISGDLQKIKTAVYGEEVRDAIHDAISQCYSDVSNPTLQTEAIEAAVQAKIDAGEMAALTIADGTVTGAKLADGTIPTAKIADGAVTMAKLSSDIDFDVDTDTTLTQPGVPADAKAVGDALADAFTGETLTDGESMKYVLSSKYDDFKLVDGYGYFDAVKLLNYSFDFQGTPQTTGDVNCVFRFEHGKLLLLGEDILDGLFSPDSLIKEHAWNGGADYLPEGFWITKDPNPIRTSRYITVPKTFFGDSGTIGNFFFNFLDGNIGLKMDSTKIREYDPTAVISAITTGGSYTTPTVENVRFYQGFLTWNWADLFDFGTSTEELNRFFNSFGLNQTYAYAKECVYTQGTRLWYRVKADAVGGAHTIENIKNYLLNVRHLKFYYVWDEVVTE